MMKQKLYEMVMEFDVTLGLKEFNSVMELFGYHEKSGITGQTITLSQTIPFIPNEEYIHKVENILKDKYETKKFNILECHFRGYKKLIEKEIDIPELEKECDMDLEME